MYELLHDPFYEFIKSYARCIIDYFLLADDKPFQNLSSHKAALSFGMLKLVDKSLKNKANTEAMFGKKVSSHLHPWRYDMEQAQGQKIDAAVFLAVPEAAARERYRQHENQCDGDRIPYWYAFLAPPHGAFFGDVKKEKNVCEQEYGPEDFHAVNKVLFPKGTGSLDVYEWTTDWSDYFDAGHEWWGASCWSIYDKDLARYVVIFVSSTD